MTKTKLEVMQALNEVDVPCSPTLSMKYIHEDKSVYEGGMVIEIGHPTRGRLRSGWLADQVVRLAGRGKAPALASEHTDQILGGLDYGQDEMRRCMRGARINP